MKTCKITKKFIQQVTSLCNIWIENPHVISEVTIWGGDKRISVSIGVWNLNPNTNIITSQIDCINKNFHSEEEFIDNKQKIIDKINKILKDNAYL